MSTPSVPNIQPQSATVAQATSESISDFGVILREIRLCNNLEAIGRSFTGPSGCLTIFHRATPDVFNLDYEEDYLQVGSIGRNNSHLFTNLMTVSGRESLTTTTELNRSGIATYRYVVLSWVPAFRIAAELQVGSISLFTIDGTLSLIADHYLSQASSAFSSSGVARTSYLAMDTDENFFALQEPFTLNSDVLEGEDLSLDLIFTPELFIEAYRNSITCSSCNLLDSAGDQFRIRPIEFVGTVRKDSLVTEKTVYVATVSSSNSDGTDTFDVRMELYNEKGSATIQGAAIQTALNESSTRVAPLFPLILLISKSSNGSFEFLDGDGNVVLSEFSAPKTRGDRAGAILHCHSDGQSPFTFKGCAGKTGDPSSITLSFTVTETDSLIE